MGPRALVALLPLLLLAGGCVQLFFIDGRACPCPEASGYVCCTPTQTCLPKGQQCGDGSDGGGADPTPDRTGPGDTSDGADDVDQPDRAADATDGDAGDASDADQGDAGECPVAGQACTGGAFAEVCCPGAGGQNRCLPGTCCSDGDCDAGLRCRDNGCFCSEPGCITYFATPSATDLASTIGLGDDGNLWYTTIDPDTGDGGVGRMTPGGTVTGFWPLPGSSYLNAIVADGQGNLWFTEPDHDLLGRITAGGSVTEFVVGAEPNQMTLGRDGRLWFSLVGDSAIGVIDPRGATDAAIAQSYRSFPTPTPGSLPAGLSRGPAGDTRIWFVEVQANQVGTIDMETHAFEEFPVPTFNGQPTAIALGADESLWFIENFGNQIARISPTGAIEEFGGLPANSGPFGMALGGDGAFWLVLYNNDKIGTFTPPPPDTGTFTFKVPAAAGPASITAGPGGTIWFTQQRLNSIGVIVP